MKKSLRAAAADTDGPTKRQRIENQIDAAFVFAGTDFVNVHDASSYRRVRRFAFIGRFSPCGRSGGAGICSGLARMIAAMRSLNFSTVSTWRCCVVLSVMNL